MVNRMRTYFLLGILTVIFVLIGSFFGKEGMYIAFFFALVMNWISYFFSDRIVLAMYRAKQVTQDEAPVLYRIVGELTQTASLPMPRIYIIPSATPNAFATGRDPSHSAVAVTGGILELLNEDELKGVLAHELGHIKNRDILVATVAATIAGAITMLARMLQWAAFLGGGSDERREGNIFGVVALLAFAILAPIAAMIVQMAISRGREYLADEDGAKLAGNPLYLAKALRKLAMGVKARPMNNANPATAHMFIVTPFSGRSILNLFSTHPPIEERIRRLESMAYQPR
ncbi:MAG TPA: zinc metalloprotease HtpX [bacterium]|nr:zinc metalloprotease HtpX [bacterium]HPP30068.1 zinc metalloprotease HtpX [bacterium]